MIRDVLFGKSSLDLAKKALDAGALRQRVISSNLANAATPGYRAQEVAFEELLSAEQQSIRMQATEPGHFQTGKTGPLPAPLVRPRGGEVDASGVNDVSVEREMTELTENTIHFQAMSQLLVNKYRGIRDSIRPGA